LSQSATKAASQNISALLRSAHKLSSHRNNGASDEIEGAFGLSSSKVVDKGVVQEDVMGLAVVLLDTAAKAETNPTRPFRVRCRSLMGSKNRRMTKVHMQRSPFVVMHKKTQQKKAVNEERGTDLQGCLPLQKASVEMMLTICRVPSLP
jgi:hypothetical protein